MSFTAVKMLTEKSVRGFIKMVNYDNLNKMCSWERQKALFLIKIAEDLNINIECYGELAVNPNSGYTYLWLEDYNFTLYMPINCELKKGDIRALWSCPECGQEEESNLKEEDSLKEIEARINEIGKEHYKDAHPQELQ